MKKHHKGGGEMDNQGPATRANDVEGGTTGLAKAGRSYSESDANMGKLAEGKSRLKTHHGKDKMAHSSHHEMNKEHGCGGFCPPEEYGNGGHSGENEGGFEGGERTD